jgi:hypothetical protein
VEVERERESGRARVREKERERKRERETDVSGFADSIRADSILLKEGKGTRKSDPLSSLIAVSCIRTYPQTKPEPA